MRTRRPGVIDRRHAPRIRLPRRVYGREAESGTEVLLSDLSPESFSLESSVPFAIGKEHRFQFPGEPQTVTAVARRCERAGAGAGATRYISGFEFRWKTPAERAYLDTVIRELRRQQVAAPASGR